VNVGEPVGNAGAHVGVGVNVGEPVGNAGAHVGVEIDVNQAFRHPVDQSPTRSCYP